MRLALGLSFVIIFAACSSTNNSQRPPQRDEDPSSTEDTTDTTDTSDPQEESPDTDGDGVADADDPCPEDATQTVDTDGDGICDGPDDCPEDPAGSVDSNADGICNEDDDTDGDGISDGEERIYGEDCGISNPALADSDRDGIEDMDDPYPRDPWPEFILYRNDHGTIDLMLSNRDGSFQEPIQVGLPYGGSESTTYRYIQFAISDFDDNGRMDFLALADNGPNDDVISYDVWWFWRTKSDELEQRLLGQTQRSPFATIADLNNDDIVDMVGLETERPDYIDSIVLRYYANQKKVETATCFATDNPDNPDGCAFVTRESIDITSWVAGQWSYRQSRDAVDVNGDGHRDIAILRISSGGNSANVPITVLFGRGDGTFDAPAEPLFTHNTMTCGNSPANSLLFGDFDLDEIGDVITGLDDDGDAGSAWFYPGTLESGAYGIDSTSCQEAFDLNPDDEGGGEHPGVSSSANNFDFNFDGIQDIMVGYRYEAAWTGPSKTVLLFGRGDGTFGEPVLIRDFPDSGEGSNFAVPKRVCARFPMQR